LSPIMPARPEAHQSLIDFPKYISTVTAGRP
jgi:hypothetical protein